MKISRLLFYLLFLSSCTFEPEGLNFVEVEEPTALQRFQISLSTDEDSICLYGPTQFSVSLNSFGKKLNVALIQFYNNTHTVDQPNFSFTITPEETSEWTDLTISIYASTGSGSIADKLKVENYVMSRTWKIKYIDLSKDGIKTGYQIHPEGYLELFVIPPKQLKNKTFSISKYGNLLSVSRTSGDTTFYADKSYCSGFMRYYFSYVYETFKTYQRDIEVNMPNAELKVEAVGIDSCKISWSKSTLKLYYTINDTQYKGFGNEFSTSIIPNEVKYIKLDVFPPDYGAQRLSSFSVSKNFTLGTKANYFMCYSLVKDRFFISKDIDLTYLESSTLPLPESEVNSQYKSKVNILCSPNGKYIAGYLYSQIYAYNEDLNFSKKINVGNIPHYRPYFALTNDGAFSCLRGTKIVIQNVSGSADWDSLSFVTDVDPNPNVVYFSQIANSIDGRYVCAREQNGFRIFDVSDHKTVSVAYEYQGKGVASVIAHPTNPGLIYVKVNGILQLRTCPEFELIKTIEMPISDYYLHSIDPYSGVVLLMKDNYYYFIDQNTSRILLKLVSGSVMHYNVILARNQFKMSSSVLDLTNYLK